MPKKLECPTAGEVAKKWGEVTPGRATYYEQNTPGAADEWERNTIAAKGTFKAAIQAAGIENRFAGGVRGQASKFSRKVSGVGKDRFGPGVAAAIEDMATGFGPYATLLNTISIPDRKPRGDPANYEIVKKIGDPLHKKRLALLGAGGSVGAK